MKRTFTFVLLLTAYTTMALAGLELTSAKIYKKQGDIGKAIEFYDQAVAKEPDNAEALFERGELLGIIAMDPSQVGLRKKIAGDAATYQRSLILTLLMDNSIITDTETTEFLLSKYRGVTADTTDFQRRVLWRMVQDFDAIRAMGDDKKAKKYAKKMETQTADNWWIFYSKAVDADSVYRAMEASGSIENAATVISNGLADATTAILLDPKHWSSRFVYAQLRGFQQKDEGFVTAWDEAIAALENSDLRTKEPENFASNRRYARLQLIQYYYSQENFSQTLLSADQMLADEPGLVEAVQYKAYALATMANDEKRPESERDSLKRVALGALINAKESNPEDENILYYIGQFNFQLKDTAAALSAFDDFLIKAPNDGVVLAMQGVVYLESEKFGDLDKAIAKLEAAKNADPENGAYWTNYGIALLRKGKNAEGMKAMETGKSLSGK